MSLLLRPQFLLPAALLLALAACNGDDEEGNGPAAASPGPATTAGERTAVPGDTCQPGSGPPAEGAGPEGLPGRISFVRLVFGCNPDIYIMDSSGANARALTDDPALDDESDLSPDGSRVVFFSGREGNAFLYIVNADGSNLQQITTGAGGDTSPRWSPDGGRIAFSRSGSIFVMNADGSGITMIMESQSAVTAAPCRAGSFVGSWSPDGNRIVYYSAILGEGGQNIFWICAIDADGQNLEVLVAEPEGKLHAEPYWSPDGRYIAFRDDRDGDCTPGGECDYEIYTLDLETGAQRNVTNHPSLDIEPAWSPDGEWIVFASNREDPNFDLYVVRPDGSDLQRLLADPEAKDSYPSWR